MSTSQTALSPSADIACCNTLRRFLLRRATERYLLRPENLAGRLTALDELDAISHLDQLACATCPDSAALIDRLRDLRFQFEAANQALYESARARIARHGHSFILRRWLMEPVSDEDGHNPRPGLGFDVRDEIVSGVLQLREPGETLLPPSAEIAPYQPTPARHILDLIAVANLSPDDVLVDLGSGLGQVPLLTSILAGNRTLGVELQPAYVACAQESARNLNLDRARFVAADARKADLSSGAVFYLFSPFTGSILRDVLQRLLSESKKRQITICSLGPCTRVLQDQPWLEAKMPPNSERITAFESQ